MRIALLTCLAVVGCGSPAPSPRAAFRVIGGGGHFAAGWSGWDDVGAAVYRDTAPALAIRDGKLHLFFRDPSGCMVHAVREGGDWRVGAPALPIDVRGIAAVALGPDVHLFYARAPDGAWIHETYHPSGGGDFEELPLFALSSWQGLAATAMTGSGRFARDRLDLFVVGPQDAQGYAIYQATKSGDGPWSGWSIVPDTDNAHSWYGPAATSWGYGRIDLVYTARDHLVHHSYFSGDAWHTGVGIAGDVIGAPAISSNGAGSLDVFVARQDGQFHAVGDGVSWSGGAVPSDRRAACVDEDLYIGARQPAAVAWGKNQIDLAIAGRDGHLWHDVYDNFPDGSTAEPPCACEFPGETCGGGRVCDAHGVCTGCGAIGALCCADGGCDPGGACAGGTCTACGARGQPCCSDGCGDGSVCDGTTCVCGALGQTCCGGSTCDAGAVCGTDNRCTRAPSFAVDVYPLLAGGRGGYQCAQCHRQDATWPHAPHWLHASIPEALTDAADTLADLIGSGYVLRDDNKPADSPLYSELASGAMPLHAADIPDVPFTSTDLALVAAWIRGGANP